MSSSRIIRRIVDSSSPCLIVLHLHHDYIQLTQLPVPNARAPPLLLFDRRRNDAVLITKTSPFRSPFSDSLKCPCGRSRTPLFPMGWLTGLSRSARIKETKGVLNWPLCLTILSSFCSVLLLSNPSFSPSDFVAPSSRASKVASRWSGLKIPFCISHATKTFPHLGQGRVIAKLIHARTELVRVWAAL